MLPGTHLFYKWGERYSVHALIESADSNYVMGEVNPTTTCTGRGYEWNGGKGGKHTCTHMHTHIRTSPSHLHIAVYKWRRTADSKGSAAACLGTRWGWEELIRRGAWDYFPQLFLLLLLGHT